MFQSNVLPAIKRRSSGQLGLGGPCIPFFQRQSMIDQTTPLLDDVNKKLFLADNLRKQCEILRFDDEITTSDDLILNTNTTDSYHSMIDFKNDDQHTQINKGSLFDSLTRILPQMVGFKGDSKKTTGDTLNIRSWLKIYGPDKEKTAQTKNIRSSWKINGSKAENIWSLLYGAEH